MRRLLLACALLSGVAWASNLTTKTGSLTASGAPITGAAATANSVSADGGVHLTIAVGGTVGTLSLICQQSLDNTNWTNVGSAVTALGIVCNVDYPIGFYRANVTSCSAGCSVNVLYLWAIQQ